MRKIKQHFMLKTLKPGGRGMKPDWPTGYSVKIMKTKFFFRFCFFVFNQS